MGKGKGEGEGQNRGWGSPLRGGISSTSSATSPKLVEPGEAGANDEELADNRKRRPCPWPNCQTCRIG